jgi:hypothetical protein
MFRDKMSMFRDKMSLGQKIQRDKTSSDKTSSETKCPEGQNVMAW